MHKLAKWELYWNYIQAIPLQTEYVLTSHLPCQVFSVPYIASYCMIGLFKKWTYLGRVGSPPIKSWSNIHGKGKCNMKGLRVL